MTTVPVSEIESTATSAQPAQALTKEAGILNIVASDFDARPMSYVTDKGERAGYEPALARLVCKRLGLTPVWHNLPMEDFYKCLDPSVPDSSDVAYDVIWFNQAITPERQKTVNFTQPYGLFDEAVLVRTGSEVNAPSDLGGKKVGGLADSTNIALVEGFPGAEAVPYPGSDRVLPEMLEALRKGDIDALIDDELVLIVAAEEDSSLQLGFSLPTKVPFAIGVSKENSLLLEKLNSALAELQAEGTMVEIWNTWIPLKQFPL